MDTRETVKMNSRYELECFSSWHDDNTRCEAPWDCPRLHETRLEWADGFDNIVVTAGLNKLLDATIKTGLASPTWFVGLVDNASFSAYAAGDTMASHAGWIEGVPYSNATRQAFTPGSIAAGSVDNSASKAVFNINATLTVRGAFLVDNNTKSGTTGTLYGEGDFAAARAVLSGDTLNVQITLSAS
jgi:hypothetical protein